MAQATSLPTATAGTEPGVVMGTLGYMSPEQVKGRPADARSDIFAFGAVLYEMLSGRRAFQGDSAAETMASILREDPPDLSVTNRNISPGLERIVRHSLEKNPERRFQSASDIAFDLEALSGLSGPTAASARASGKKWSRLSSLLGAGLLGGLVVGAIVYLAGARSGSRSPPSFQQLTYRRGTVWSARFGSDRKSIFYSASWDGHPTEIFVSSPESPESRPFGLSGADVLAVSASGELAVGLASTVSGEFLKTATLARTSATGGGAPRQMLEEVQFADWSPDGRELAIVRSAGGRDPARVPDRQDALRDQGLDRKSARLADRRPRRLHRSSGRRRRRRIGGGRRSDRKAAARTCSLGQPRPLPLGSLKAQAGRFLPDGRRILILATEPGRATRIYLTDVQGTRPQALTDENYRGPTFTSSDGTRFLVRGPDEKTSFYSFETRGLTTIRAVKPSDVVAGWMADGTGLYVQGPGIPAPIDRLDLATGRRERWKEIVPSDISGVVRISSVVIPPDGRFYAYAYTRVLSNLYLAEGLK